jgi:hypothetical protein
MAQLNSDYCSDKLLKYYVKIMGDFVETKGTTASEIPKHMEIMCYI